MKQELRWIYPIKAFTVINAVNKTIPFILECMVRKRLEKRLEVTLNNVTSYSSDQDQVALKLRPITPQKRTIIDATTISTNKSSDHIDLKLFNNSSPNSMTLVGGEITNLANEFVYSIQFNGISELVELAKNSIALKLNRIQRDKSNGFVNMLFDVIFSPSRSFM